MRAAMRIDLGPAGCQLLNRWIRGVNQDSAKFIKNHSQKSETAILQRFLRILFSFFCAKTSSCHILSELDRPLRWYTL